MQGNLLPLIPRKRLLKLAEKRVERFASHFSTLLTSDDPDIIHHTRVWSRRLQQTFNLMFAKPRRGEVKKLIRTLKRMRRRLSHCRDLDICLALIGEKMESAGDTTNRHAWEELRGHLQHRRGAEISASRKKLRTYNIDVIIANSSKTFKQYRRESGSGDPDTSLHESLRRAVMRWHATLVRAKEKRSPKDLHRLRIAAKRFRYRAELLSELGDVTAKAMVKSLKRLQQELGDWHDRQVLLRFVAEFIGRPDFLLHYPEISRSLLAELAKERQRNNAAVEPILTTAESIKEDGLLDLEKIS